MEEKLLLDIVQGFPVSIAMTVQNVLKRYNEKALQPISYKLFVDYLAQNEQLHFKFIEKQEVRERRIELALQEAEDRLIQNAVELGDVKSIEFLLKARNDSYREKRQVTHDISVTYREKLGQLSSAILESGVSGYLEADIADETGANISDDEDN